jgi:hypothetical protein
MKGYKSGYVIIEFISLLKNGSQRKKRDDENQKVYDLRMQRAKKINYPMCKIVYEKRILDYDKEI